MQTIKSITLMDLYDLAIVLQRSREWHAREQVRYRLHPVVVAMLKHGSPRDWHALVLEWPHISQDDDKQLAYTRDDASGQRDRQVRTAIGKYIKRHWPNVQDNNIRDEVLAYTNRLEGRMEFLPDDVEAYVRAVQSGPQSCMKWSDGPEDYEYHPYRAYAPEKGWRMAVRYNAYGQICGRVLVFEPRKIYVRSFRACDDNPTSEGYSEADEKLNVWLNGQGYTKRDSWPEGTPLARIDYHRNDCGVLVPYIDGNRQHVDVYHDRLEIVDDGEWVATNTDGDAEENESGNTCYHCDERVRPDRDEGEYVERYDRYVCADHLSRRYTWVSYREEYVLDGELEYDTNGDAVDPENPPADMTRLTRGVYEGKWADYDDTIVDIDGDTWHIDDDDRGTIVQLSSDSVDADEWVVKDDAIEVEDEWFHTSDIGQKIVRIDRGSHSDDLYILESKAIYSLIDNEYWHEDDLITEPSEMGEGDPSDFCCMLGASSDQFGHYACVDACVYYPHIGWLLKSEDQPVNRDADPVQFDITETTNA